MNDNSGTSRRSEQLCDEIEERIATGHYRRGIRFILMQKNNPNPAALIVIVLRGKGAVVRMLRSGSGVGV